MSNLRVDLIYINSGGGHRAAALALEAVIREQQKSWDIRLLGMQDLLNSIDFIRQLTGTPFEDVYNIMLRRGWTAGMKPLVPVMHGLIRLTHRQQVTVLREHWQRHPADLVVSLVPHYNRALRQAVAQACPGCPYVTVLTDIADYPPHFWIERQDQYVVCGSAKAVAQARMLGLPPDRILPVSGMILHPRFYAQAPLDQAAERVRLGLDPHRPTGLVLFGGEGSLDVVRVSRALNRPGSPVQLILLCGRHGATIQEVQAMERHIPMFVEGFTREVPYYMSLADFFIGKPGPGSLSEALAMNLPVIVERNFRTMPHERYNIEWILERQAGLAIPSLDQVDRAVAKLLQPERYQMLRSRVAALRNRGVYETVEWLDSIVARTPTLPSGDGPNLNRRLTLA